MPLKPGLNGQGDKFGEGDGTTAHDRTANTAVKARLFIILGINMDLSINRNGGKKTPPRPAG